MFAGLTVEAIGEAEAVVESRWIRRSKPEPITESVGEVPTITVGDETIWCPHQGRAGLLYQRRRIDWIEVSRGAR